MGLRDLSGIPEELVIEGAGEALAELQHRAQ